MVLSVQYTPKTGINAGKKCFPATCGDFLKSGMYRLEKTDADGKTHTFCVDDMWEVVKHVEKGCSLFMTPPDGIAFAVTADELIEANPDTFRGVRRNETGMTVSTVKRQPPKNEKLEPDYYRRWKGVVDLLDILENSELLYDGLGIRPDRKNKRAFILAMVIDGNEYLHEAALEMLEYGYTGGEPRDTAVFRAAKKYPYHFFSGVRFLQEHFAEWKLYRKTLYNPLTAQEAYAKYGADRIKDMWERHCEVWDVNLWTYIDMDKDPSWAGDFIGNTDRVKEFFYHLLWTHVIMDLVDFVGGTGEDLLAMK